MNVTHRGCRSPGGFFFAQKSTFCSFVKPSLFRRGLPFGVG